MADHRLAGDLEHVGSDRQEQEQLRGDLMSGELSGPHAARRRRRNGQRRQQEPCPLDQMYPDLDHRPHDVGYDSQSVQAVGAEAGDDDHEHHESAEDLGHDRSPRAAGDAEVQDEHEHQLDDQVHDVGDQSTMNGRLVSWMP